MRCEYERIGVRQCGAGRRRTSWGSSWTAGDDRPLCASCRITRVIPNLGNPNSATAWSRLEGAKRRLLFTLMELGLPVPSLTDDPVRGLAFEFLADPEPGGPPLLTGHAN